jgi:hypothetical protein
MVTMKTTYPPETLSFNEWMIHIYKQLNYPINDNGTKRTTSQGTCKEVGIREVEEPIRTARENRHPDKTNRRGKA